MQSITSKAEWDALIQKSYQKVVVVEFYATWCGACKQMAPTFEALFQQYSNMIFAQVDVDTINPLAVTKIPSFFYYQNGEKKEQVVGPNVKPLQTKTAAAASGNFGNASW